MDKKFKEFIAEAKKPKRDPRNDPRSGDITQSGKRDHVNHITVHETTPHKVVYSIAGHRGEMHINQWREASKKDKVVHHAGDDVPHTSEK